MIDAAPPQPQVVRPPDESDRLERLPQGWAVLPGKLLHIAFPGARPRGRRVIVLHPGIGVAVIDLLPRDASPVSAAEARETAAALRERLESADFSRGHPGHLPVVHFGLREADMSQLGTLLGAAFATDAPIGLPPESNWIEAAQRALTTEPGTPSVAPPTSPVAATANSVKARRMRWGFAAAALAAAAAGVAVLRPDGRGESVRMQEVATGAVALLSTVPERLPVMADAVAAATEPGGVDVESSSASVAATGSSTVATAVDSSVSLANLAITPPPLAEQDAVPEEPQAEPDLLSGGGPPPEPTPDRVPEASAGITPEFDVVPAAMEPFPEADAPRLADLATDASPAPQITVVEPLPEPDALRVGDLAGALQAAEAASVEPFPEPDALRAGEPVAPSQATGIAVAEPLPEPDALRMGDLAEEARPADTGAAAMAPRPEARPDAAVSQQAAPAVAAPSPEPAPAVAAASAAPAAPPALAPPAAVAARPAPLDPRLVGVLLTRGQEMFARGDVSGARLLFRRAAEGGSAEGARELGRSYDPGVLARIGARGIQPDPAQAEFWYRRADELGRAR